MKKMFIVLFMVVSLVMAGSVIAANQNGQGTDFSNGVAGSIGNQGNDKLVGNAGGPLKQRECGSDCYDTFNWGGGGAGVVSISTAGSYVGDLGNGAIAGSGAGALSLGLNGTDFGVKAKTEALALTYLQRGVEFNEYFDGRQRFNESGAYTESTAIANAKEFNNCRRQRDNLDFELNAVAVIGISGVTSSIGNDNRGAGALAGGLYVAGGVANDKIVASGYSDTFAKTWEGQTNNAQWSGAYSTNTSVAIVEITRQHSYNNAPR